jgi:hypothetical protein
MKQTDTGYKGTTMHWLLECCRAKPFSMVLKVYVDSELSETDILDLFSSIRDSLDFCICVKKNITEGRRFHIPDKTSPRGYTITFSFHIVFPDNRGSRYANKQFVEEKMLPLLHVVLEEDLPVGLEGTWNPSETKTYALLCVP